MGIFKFHRRRGILLQAHDPEFPALFSLFEIHSAAVRELVGILCIYELAHSLSRSPTCFAYSTMLQSNAFLPKILSRNKQ
jgi:hypothetical protein